jgi:hypothetical protein
MEWLLASSAFGLALMTWWLLRPPYEPRTVEDMIAAKVAERLVSHPHKWRKTLHAGINPGVRSDSLNAWVGEHWMDGYLIVVVEGRTLDLSGGAKREIGAARKGYKRWREAQDLMSVARAFSKNVEQASG